MVDLFFGSDRYRVALMAEAGLIHGDRRDRPAVFAVGIQFWINGMVAAAVIPRLPDIRDRLDMNVATLGTVLTLGALGGLLGSASSERIIARFGTRRCIQGGTFAMVAVLPFIGLVRSPTQLVVALALLAGFDVVIDIAMNLQGSWLSAGRTTPVMNRLHGLWSLGTVIGGLVAVRAAGAGVSLVTHLLGVSIVLACTLAVSGRFLLGVDLPPVEQVEVTDRIAGISRSGPPSWLSPGPKMVLVVLGAAAIIMELTTSDWAAFRLADDLAVGPGQAGLGFVAFTSGMVTGRFAGDAIQGAVGKRTLVRGASILAAFGLTLATLVPYGRVVDRDVVSTGLVLVGFFVAALGVSVIFPQLYDAAAQSPGRSGAGLAALTAGTRIAGVLTPIVVGFVAGTSLSVGAAIALVTIPSCAVTLLVLPSER